LQLAWRLLSLDHLVGAARAPAIRRTDVTEYSGLPR